MTVEILPVTGLPEFQVEDDLAALLAEPLRALVLRDDDIVAITQKVVSKVEGRVVPVGGDDRSAWVAHETRRVVARRGDLVIAETEHGFVCANAGVDASNVPEGFVSLLPEDPDRSAEGIRRELAERLGLERLGVVITDTFGRPWRTGLVNVAIGCAGLPALVDLRGQPDHLGRELEVTVVALADEVAAGTGLVMGKAARVPVAIVRGLDTTIATHGSAAALVRPSDEDLFRTSPLQALISAAPARSFGGGDVPRDALEEAVLAACATPGPDRDRSWRFVAAQSETSKRGLVDAVTGEHPDPDETILRAAAVLIVPWIRFPDPRGADDLERSHARQERSLLAAGAAVHALMLALHARGLACAWSGSTLFRQRETRAALGVPDEWFALGAVAVGPAGPGAPPAPGPVDPNEILEVR